RPEPPRADPPGVRRAPAPPRVASARGGHRRGAEPPRHAALRPQGPPDHAVGPAAGADRRRSHRSSAGPPSRPRNEVVAGRVAILFTLPRVGTPPAVPADA